MIRSVISTLVLVCSGFFSFSQKILVQPYLQPGNASALTKEMKVLIWQTDSIPGKFKVEISLSSPNQKVSEAKISITKLCLNNKTSLLYRASLNGLKFDATYRYKVFLDEKVLTESTFNTRSKNQNTRFAVLGDCGAGTLQQAQIANQIYQSKPEFVLITGDNVYQRGLENEYRKNFFPYYNAAEANPEVGAPLMRSIPFYLLIGNHDVFGADLDKTPDGLAYFYYSDLPLNGPTPRKCHRTHRSTRIS
jgi:phosphodiesterase/alkaline phosphatase D-like protein